jgi:hypothetical protein
MDQWNIIFNDISQAQKKANTCYLTHMLNFKKLISSIVITEAGESRRQGGVGKCW